MHAEGHFPQIHSFTRIGDKLADNQVSIFDVKFYPYTEPDTDPVFAAVAGRDVFVCRPLLAHPSFEVLRVFRDPDEDILLNSLVWSQDLATGNPLICIAGAGSKKIKILDVKTGELTRIISGHGGDVNDLVISPLSPQILASCSADYSIRIWNLDLKYVKQPCAAILSGEGHRQPILALDFHAKGKYLVSGGQDATICLWAVPDVPDANAGTDKTTVVYYPHFASIDVHSDFVDCVKFWGDLILSRASGGGKAVIEDQYKRNDILLWKIDGFSSADPVPLDPPLPGPGKHTRSAFGGSFQRLLTFKLDLATPFYMRFSLFSQPDQHPILVMGNERSRYFFWDLQALEENLDVGDDARELTNRPMGKKRGRPSAFAGGAANLGRELSLASGTSSAHETNTSYPSNATSERARRTDDPFKPIVAHHKVIVPSRHNFSCRQVAWSNCGKWCVAVGDRAYIVIFKR